MTDTEFEKYLKRKYGIVNVHYWREMSKELPFDELIGQFDVNGIFDYVLDSFAREITIRGIPKEKKLEILLIIGDHLNYE